MRQQAKLVMRRGVWPKEMGGLYCYSQREKGTVLQEVGMMLLDVEMWT